RRRAERVHLPVGAADVDAAVRGRRRRVELAALAEPLLRRRLPEQLPRLAVQGVEMVVVRADEDAIARDRDAALDLVLRLEGPLELPVDRVERVHTAAPVPEVDDAVDDDGRRLTRGGAR